MTRLTEADLRQRAGPAGAAAAGAESPQGAEHLSWPARPRLPQQLRPLQSQRNLLQLCQESHSGDIKTLLLN